MPAAKTRGPAVSPPGWMPLMVMMKPTAIVNALIEPISGQGLGSTRW
jgi:hypothetical protein